MHTAPDLAPVLLAAPGAVKGATALKAGAGTKIGAPRARAEPCYYRFYSTNEIDFA